MGVQRSFATAAIVASCLCASAASALEFPIRGAFGDPENGGCASLRAEEEGAYVAFNEGGRTGENGEGGCDYRRMETLGRNRYRLIGSCSSLDGRPARETATLVVISKDQVVYKGTRYTRCR